MVPSVWDVVKLLLSSTDTGDDGHACHSDKLYLLRQNPVELSLLGYRFSGSSMRIANSGYEYGLLGKFIGASAGP